SSQLPTYLLSKYTREHVTVALSGDAGDENFGGYDKYRRHVLLRRYRPLIHLLAIAQPLIGWSSKRLTNDFLDRLSIFLQTVRATTPMRHYNFTSYFDEFTKVNLYTSEFAERVIHRVNPFEMIANTSLTEMDTVFHLDFNTYIPDDINVKVDLASMANALEVRAPLLDYELVNLMARMPWQLKVGMINSKIIFKKMLRRYLPHEILYRKKYGFSVPLKHWFRNELRDFAKKVVTQDNGLVLKIFKKEKIQKLLHDHQKGKDNSKKIWSLMALNIWHRQNF
ncbi:MAG: asparagine synthase C-terminal domain-containing protein, partial [Candidatus Rickettsiella isopodorum]|nr:asparagine synthase C-terminal domain-containing protein [Candidatus Rickettsiella isopodorum]